MSWLNPDDINAHPVLFHNIPNPSGSIIRQLTFSIYTNIFEYIYIYINHYISTTVFPLYFQTHFPSSTTQGGGGSLKDRTPIGEVSCCDSWVAEGTDGPKGG